jgi:hypothetical protein
MRRKSWKLYRLDPFGVLKSFRISNQSRLSISSPSTSMWSSRTSWKPVAHSSAKQVLKYLNQVTLLWAGQYVQLRSPGRQISAGAKVGFIRSVVSSSFKFPQHRREMITTGDSGGVIQSKDFLVTSIRPVIELRCRLVPFLFVQQVSKAVNT